jgi:Zn-dependent M28 family amino/carboxypeptidase
MRPTIADQPATMPEIGAPEPCGTYAVDSLMKCVEEARIEADIRLIAKPRPPDSEHHEAVRKLCRERLSKLGFDTRDEPYGTGTNVVGVKPGFSKPGEHVIVSAHYDHVDRCEGADDNASGVAAVLETARVLAEARLDRSLVVACWDEAEQGQKGSTAYARTARERNDRIVAVFAYESVAFASSAPDSQRIPDRFEELFPDQALAMLDNDYRADFVTVVADTTTESWGLAVVKHGKEVELSVQVLTLTAATKARQQSLHRSDHSSFWDANFPALLVTDSGPFRNPHSHCENGQDSPDTLDYGFAGRVTRAALGAVVDALELR